MPAGLLGWGGEAGIGVDIQQHSYLPLVLTHCHYVPAS